MPTTTQLLNPDDPRVRTALAALATQQALFEVHGERGRFRAANEAALALFGRTLGDLLGRSLDDVVVGSEDGTRRLLLDRSPAVVELQVQHTDGSPRWFRCWTHPTEDDGVLVVASDVTAARTEVVELRSTARAVDRAQAVLEFSPDGTVERVNANALDLLGYEEDDVVGQHHGILCDPGYAASSDHVQFWRRLRAGSTESGEFTRYGSGGREVRVRATYNPVFSLDGKVRRIIQFAYDVTDTARRTADLEGRVSAIDRSQAVIEFDLDGRILDANRNFLDLLGYKLEEVRGQHHRIFVDPDDAAKPEYVQFWEQLSQGKFDEGTYRRVTKSGEDVFIQATYNPILDADGRPRKVVKYASDVTAATIANAEYASRVSAVDRAQAVIEFDLEGTVLTANDNFLRTMGYSLAELRGQHHSLFCTADYRVSAEYRDFWLRLRKGDFIAGRFHRVGKFDRDVWIQATYNPIFDLRGNPVKVVKYAYDVTQQALLEQLIQSKSGAMTETVAELSESIDLIAGGAGEANQLAARTDENARAGAEAIKGSLQAIELIRTSASAITEIVRVIGEIAGQTNLLAFNASIEAARAGEHGVGFSVVAGEVRKLAERSSTAAGQIAELIAESERRVAEGAEISRSAQGAFEEIARSVAATSTSIASIAAATRNQQDTSAVVKALIDELAAQIRPGA